MVVMDEKLCGNRAEEAEMRLVQLAEKHAVNDVELKQIEKQIYDLEGVYLQYTSAYGNIISGFNRYLSIRAVLGDGKPGIKKRGMSDAMASGEQLPHGFIDPELRLFSKSSLTQDGILDASSEGKAAMGNNKNSTKHSISEKNVGAANLDDKSRDGASKKRMKSGKVTRSKSSKSGNEKKGRRRRHRAH